MRAAALLHDLGKLDTSRDVLHRAAELNNDEREQLARGASKFESVSVSMSRVLPVILAHHDRYDGGGFQPIAADEIPLEARIIAVADVYDALIDNRTHGQAIAPLEAVETILDSLRVTAQPYAWF